jgi:hypothetical protein
MDMSVPSAGVHRAILALTFGLATAVQGGTVLYVDADAQGAGTGANWADAMTTLRQALDAAAAQPEVTEIWVAEGYYAPTEIEDYTRPPFDLLSGVALYGGFSGSELHRDERDPDLHETVLESDLFEHEPHVRAIHVQDAVLDGFHVNSTVEGGMLIDSSRCTISRCRIVGNHTTAIGGVLVRNSTVEFRDCVLGYNHAYGGAGGGGMRIEGSEALLTRCRIENNVAGVLIGSYRGGGGLHVSTSTVRLTGCALRGNRVLSRSEPCGGGGLLAYDSDVTMVHCIVAGNSVETYQQPSGMGGGCWIGGRASIENCVFTGNRVDGAGGGVAALVSASGDRLTILNSTFTGNTASDREGGLGNAGQALVANCVFWDNRDATGATFAAQAGLTPVLYTCIQGLASPANGNTGLAPRFIDANGQDEVYGTPDDDLRLQPGSPCIDAGDSTALPADVADLDGDGDVTEPLPLDLDGRPRRVDDPSIPDTGAGNPPVVDMGAYEYQPPVQLVRAASLKAHAGRGVLELDLPLIGDPGSEPRAGGPEMILLVFSAPVRGTNGHIAAQDLQLSAGSINSVSDSSEMVKVEVSGIANGACLTLDLSGVVGLDGTPLSGPTQIRLRALHGDVNGDGEVASGDIAQVKQRSGQATTAENCRFDLNADGIIASGDITQAKRRAGLTAQCP